MSERRQKSDCEKAEGVIFRKDQQRATISLDAEPDGRPVARIAKTSASGKQSVSSLKHTAQFAGPLLDWAKSTVMDRAAVKLLKDGYRLVPPQDSAVQLAVFSEMGPRVGMPFAVDRTGSTAWLGDFEVVRKVDLATAEVVDLPLAAGTIVFEMDIDPQGQLWMLAENESRAGLEILQMKGQTFQPVESVARSAHSPAALSLAISDNGLCLRPHLGGAAIYSPDGALLHQLAAQPTRHQSSRAALDPSGTWAAVTAGPSLIRRLNIASGQWDEWGTPIDDVLELWINAQGVVHISANVGTWCCGPADATRLAESCSCCIDEQGRCIQARDLGLLGLVRSCRLQSRHNQLFARTDLGVFQMLSQKS